MTTYRNPAELTAAVLRDCAPLQRERVQLFLAEGYHVYEGHGRGGFDYVASISKGDRDSSRIVFPDGSILAPTKGKNKFSLDWNRIAQMSRTVPAPGLVKHREQKAA